MWMMFVSVVMATLITTAMVMSSVNTRGASLLEQEGVARQMVSYTNTAISKCKATACTAGEVDPSDYLPTTVLAITDGRFVALTDGSGQIATVYVSGVGNNMLNDQEVLAGMRSLNISSSAMGYWDSDKVKTASITNGNIAVKLLPQGFGGYTFTTGEPVMVSF